MSVADVILVAIVAGAVEIVFDGAVGDGDAAGSQVLVG